MAKVMFPNCRILRLAKISVLCGCVFVLGLLCFVTFPYIFNGTVQNMKGEVRYSLKPGSEMRELFTEMPFAITVKIYMFNVTNPAEVTKGAKPILDEVGPFYFE